MPWVPSLAREAARVEPEPLAPESGPYQAGTPAGLWSVAYDECSGCSAMHADGCRGMDPAMDGCRDRRMHMDPAMDAATRIGSAALRMQRHGHLQRTEVLLAAGEATASVGYMSSVDESVLLA